VLKGSDARFRYQLAQSQATARYDMVTNGALLYIRKLGASTWKATTLSGANTLFMALRLDLLRQTVLLASTVSASSLAHLDSGFARKFAVRPAADQLQELESVSLDGAAATQFLRTASGEVDVFLGLTEDTLMRVEVHLTGVDPSNGERQDLVSSLDAHASKVGAIPSPVDAQQVAAADALT
jgi:hypothetical protein